jgi:hypothetical protein
VASPAARREKRLRRGSTARMRASPPFAAGSTATQSPTAGKSTRAKARWRSRPETRDDFLKKGVTIRYSYFDKDKQHIASIDVTPKRSQSENRRLTIFERYG